jgi:hypothetical protein
MVFAEFGVAMLWSTFALFFLPNLSFFTDFIVDINSLVLKFFSSINIAPPRRERWLPLAYWW